MKKAQQTIKEVTESYKKMRVPYVPSVFDFKQFTGYTEEYTSDMRHISPRETD